MEIIFSCCAGLDVHKRTIMVCVRRAGFRTQVRQFGTTTTQIQAMAKWLTEQGVTHVAMESTGVYWKPIWNLLEGHFELLLCNAQHIKKVAGRKTDVKDCEWIAQLLQFGLLRASFVPSRPIRELRELTRHRAQLVSEKTRVANRLQKVLEDANVKLSSVASDLLGVSGRAMLQGLCDGEQQPDQLAELARGRLRSKRAELRDALLGNVTEHHRFMLATLMQHLRGLEALEAQLSHRIEQLMTTVDAQTPDPPARSASTTPPDTPPAPSSAAVPFTEAVQLLDTIPGVDLRAAQCVIAELGNNMSQFPDEHHLASWAKVCPGNNESAGKAKPAPTGKGNRWLTRVLGQIACSASRQTKTYFSAQYRRIAARRGKARALTAVAHSIIVTIFHMLTKRVSFHDLGADYFHRRSPEKVTRYLVRRLETLGHHVTLQPQGAAV